MTGEQAREVAQALGLVPWPGLAAAGVLLAAGAVQAASAAADVTAAAAGTVRKARRRRDQGSREEMDVKERARAAAGAVVCAALIALGLAAGLTGCVPALLEGRRRRKAAAQGIHPGEPVVYRPAGWNRD